MSGEKDRTFNKKKNHEIKYKNVDEVLSLLENNKSVQFEIKSDGKNIIY